MSSGLFGVFARARAELEIAPGATRAEIKAAYRKSLRLHPPDRDPEGFQRIRDAYELLVEPGPRVRELILLGRPYVPPPRLEVSSVPRGAAALAVLRHAASQLDARELLAELPQKNDNALPQKNDKATGELR